MTSAAFCPLSSYTTHTHTHMHTRAGCNSSIFYPVESVAPPEKFCSTLSSRTLTPRRQKKKKKKIVTQTNVLFSPTFPTCTRTPPPPASQPSILLIPTSGKDASAITPFFFPPLFHQGSGFKVIFLPLAGSQMEDEEMSIPSSLCLSPLISTNVNPQCTESKWDFFFLLSLHPTTTTSTSIFFSSHPLERG